MKKIITLLSFSVLLSLVLPGQQAPWVSFFGGSGPQFATDIKQTSDNGYIIAAYNSENYSPNFYVVKLDEAGELQWEANISKDNYTERAYSVMETASGDFIVIGKATMLNRPWVVKLNIQGDTIWASQWTNSLPQNSAVIARGTLLPDETIVVIGAEGQLGSQPNMFLVNQEGALLEQRTLNAVVPPGWYSGTIVNHIENTADGGFILTGTAGGGSGSKAFLWKFDQNADSVWTVLFNNPELGMRSANSVKQLSDGGYILVGFSSPNSEHSCAMRVDAFGQVVWFQMYPDDVYTQATDIVEWNDGTFLITEIRFDAVGQTIFESALLRIDSDGNLLNRDIITADETDVAIFRMRKTNDGGYVMAGEINETNIMGEQDLFVLKSDPWGDITTSFFNIILPADKFRGQVPDLKDMIGEFPNLVYSNQLIRIAIPKETEIISIHTIDGSRTGEIITRGSQAVQIMAPSKPGMYFLTFMMMNGEFVTRRLVVV